MKKINPSIEKNIIQLYMNGKSSYKIVKELSIPERTVLRILRRNNVKIRGKQTISPKKYSEIVKKYQDGAGLVELSNFYKASCRTISKILQSNLIKLRTQSQTRQYYKINENYFDNINNNQKAYVLGFLWADGHNDLKNNNLMIRLSSKDLCLLKKIKKWMKSNHPIRFYKNNGHQYVSFCVKNKQISKSLLSLGMVNNKTYFPRYPKIKSRYIQAFVRGYFDGDGCWTIYKSGRQIRTKATITSVKKILKWIGNKIYKSTNIRFGLYSSKYSVAHELTKNGKLLIKFGEWLYKNKQDAFLGRKFNKFLKIKDFLQ